MKTFKFHRFYNREAPELIELELPENTKFAYMSDGYDYKDYQMDMYDDIWTVVKDNKDGTIKKHLMSHKSDNVIIHQWADLIFIEMHSVMFPKSYLALNSEIRNKYKLGKYYIIYLDKEKKIISISKLDKPLSAESMIVRTISCDYSFNQMEYMFSFKKERTQFFPGSHINAWVNQTLYVNDKFADKIYRSYLKYIKANLSSLTSKYINDDIFHDLCFHSDKLVQEAYLNKLQYSSDSTCSTSVRINLSETDLWNMNLLMKSMSYTNDIIQTIPEIKKMFNGPDTCSGEQ